MKRSDGSTMQAAGRVIPVGEQYAPEGDSGQYGNTLEQLKSSYAEAQATAVIMRKDHSADSLKAHHIARENMSELISTVRIFAKRVVIQATEGNPPAGVEEAFQVTDQKRHINAFVSNAASTVQKVGENWEHFLAAGCPQDFLSKLEDAFDALLVAREQYNKAQGERKDAMKKFSTTLHGIRRQMQALHAILRAYHGAKHDSVVVFKETKQVYRKQKGKELLKGVLKAS